jgi:DNA polymerase delta subunit 4
MKGFYRQKKNSGITKPSSSLKKSPKHAATCGSDVTQPAALLSHGSPDLKGLSLPLPLFLSLYILLYC